jgi:hypothetical protein
MVLMMISLVAFSRSHHRSKILKLLTIYFKSCGLATKAFDTIHALGIGMSQKWAYKGLESLSNNMHEAMQRDIEKYLWFSTHDNLNIAFQVGKQRLGNQSHFDSGTAATIVIIKDPLAIQQNNRDLQRQMAIGSQSPITYSFVLKLEAEAAQCINKSAVHHVLSILTSTPAFNFDTYNHKDHPIFKPLASVHELPIGPEHTTCQYMLDTVHMEEVSYEGNDCVLHEWWRQLGLDSPEKQKHMGEDAVLVWPCDQLTVSRIRGLQRFRCQDLNSFDRLDFIKVIFGWFHAQIAVEHSILAQYYGTQLGFGLVHAFDLLKQKGLHSAAVQGSFHQNICEALRHIMEARFRDLWCVVGKVDQLQDLRQLSPEQLHALAVRIVDNCASTAALIKMAAKKDNKDELLYQSVQMARNLLDYVELDESIKYGDVGRLENLLPWLLFRFIGGQSKNYAIEVLELLQGLHREWPADLR